MLKRIVFCILAAVFCLPNSSWAALKSSTQAAENPQASYNPNPSENDLELPMPGGLKMILRPVAIPANGVLDDMRVNMGLRSPSEDRGVYEKQRAVHISAPFRQENLPASWRGKLPRDEAENFCYYFIGKYELSNGQWAAVMGGEIAPDTAALPKTDISWYDLQNFLCRYNEWLLKEHPASLPNIDKVPAYFRLPTEVEWEFAAKGGNLPPERLENSDFLLDEGKVVEDYAVFGSRYDNAMPIGTRLPNSLGIYDMAGNVEEMVQSGFHFTITDSVAGGGRTRRLHGAEGGLLAKGGSFLSVDEKDVYPGKRVELRMFKKDSSGNYLPHSTRSLGTRLVLTSINVPGMERATSIQKDEYRLNKSVIRAENEKKVPEKSAPSPLPTAEPGSPGSAPKDRLVTLDMEGDPLQELDKIYAAASTPFMKSNLDQLRGLLQDISAALARERDNNLLSNLRSAVYKEDSLINVAYRCYQLDHTLENFERLLKNPNLPKKERAAREPKVAVYKNNISEQFQSLELVTNVYRLSVKELAEYPEKDVSNKLKQLAKEYSGDDGINKRFRMKINMLAEHLAVARKDGSNALTNERIWRQTIIEKPILDVLDKLQQAKYTKSAKKPK